MYENENIFGVKALRELFLGANPSKFVKNSSLKLSLTHFPKKTQ